MPGYLTSMMVLIETDKWLADLENTLNGKAAAGRSKLEETVLGLARRVRNDHLRYVNSAARTGFPPTQTTAIDNQVGTGLSQYAFAGAIGPDLPAAGNILALNQRWVAETIHQGSQRRAWKTAGTTQYVLDRPPNIAGTVRTASNEVFAEYAKLDQTLRVGHLAGVAAHVILQPFIQKWAWDNVAPPPSTASKLVPWPFGTDVPRGDPIRFSVQIDAKVAQAYFQRKDLHSGQSWTAYLPDDKAAIDFICGRHLNSFKAIYGSDPKEAVSAVPSFTDLTKTYPGLQTLLGDDSYDKDLRNLLKQKLQAWSGWPPGWVGYDDILTKEEVDKWVYFDNPKASDPKVTIKDLADESLRLDPLRKALSDAVKQIPGLQDKLTDYPSGAPNLSKDFFSDAYANTRNWALDAGYDHAPFAVSLAMSLVILLSSANPIDVSPDAPAAVKKIVQGSNFGVTMNVWNATVSFGDDTADEAVVQAGNRQAWVDHGLGQETIWFDMFDQAYGSQGPHLFVFNAVLTGISLLGFDGIFGQNADALAGLPKFHPRKLYLLFNDMISPLFLFPFVLQKWLVKYYRKPYFRWPFYFLVNLGPDGLEELVIAAGNRSTGLQGDYIGLRIWYLRLWTTGAYILGSALAFGVKATKSRDNPENNSKAWPYPLDPTWEDYLLGMVFPLVMIAVIVWYKSGFEGALLQSLTGVAWPSTDTDLVDGLLPIDPANNGNSFRSGTGTPRPVALFDASTLKQGDDADAKGNPVPNSYFPEADPSTAWDDRSAADEQARMNAHKPSTETYQLKQLFDRAAVFSSILSMALVNYNDAMDNFTGTDAEKTAKQNAVGAVFQDWNLNYRTEDEWNGLMLETSGGKPGLLPAAEHWLADLKASRASDTAVLDRLKEVFGLQGAAN
jgi:hypothetical protein